MLTYPQQKCIPLGMEEFLSSNSALYLSFPALYRQGSVVFAPHITAWKLPIERATFTKNIHHSLGILIIAKHVMKCQDRLEKQTDWACTGYQAVALGPFLAIVMERWAVVNVCFLIHGNGSSKSPSSGRSLVSRRGRLQILVCPPLKPMVLTTLARRGTKTRMKHALPDCNLLKKHMEIKIHKLLESCKRWNNAPGIGYLLFFFDL